MSHIDDALEQISKAAALLLPQASFLNPTARALSRLNAACQELESLKAEHPPLDSPLILRKDMELKLFAQGWSSRYLRVSMGDDGIFKVGCILIDEIDGETAEIKVDDKWPTEGEVQEYIERTAPTEAEALQAICEAHRRHQQ